MQFNQKLTTERYHAASFFSCSEVFCRYLQAEKKGTVTNYLHDPKQTLAIACVEAVRPKFQELMKDELMESLCHDYSTNHVESANSILWSIDGKSTFSSAKNVIFAADLSSSLLNDGYEATYR